MSTFIRFLLLAVAGLLPAKELDAQHQKTTEKKQVASRLFANSLKITTGDYYIRNTFHAKGPVVQVGAFYERKVYKRWHVGIGYMEWNTLWKGGMLPANNYHSNEKTFLYEENSLEYIAFYSKKEKLYEPVIDAIEVRFLYKMADVFIFYKHQFGKSSHFINIGAGVSYNWGLNSHLAWYAVNPNPPGDAQAIHYTKKVSYWGVIPQASYDFWFLKNRFNVGGGYRARYYPGRVKIQHDISIHAGVNF